MEEITKRWNSISLSEKEGMGLRLKEEQASTEFAIAARFLTKRPLNIEAIANTFTPLWRTKSGFKIKNLGNHLILFSFDNIGDVQKILKSEPWSFDKHLMVLTQYEKDTSLNPLDLTQVPFWVQVYDIPVRFKNREVAEKICEPMGAIIHPPDAPDSDGGSFIRVRVLVDISLPICRGRLITLENGKEHWVSFKYERLPNLCYWCGLLTHGDKDCNKWIDSEGSLQSEDQQFGPWLRAPPFQAARKNVLNVPGFFAQKNKANSAHFSPGTLSQPPTVFPEKVSVSNPHPLSALNVKDPKKSNPEISEVSQAISNSKLKPTRLVPPNSDFEHLIQEIDQEITRYDQIGALHKDSNGPTSNLNPKPDSSTPPPKPTITPPLQDITNRNRASTPPRAHDETKWVRMQRPAIHKEENTLGVSLGKRTHSVTKEELAPSKRRAHQDSLQDENLSPTAAAAFQPRRTK